MLHNTKSLLASIIKQLQDGPHPFSDEDSNTDQPLPDQDQEQTQDMFMTQMYFNSVGSKEQWRMQPHVRAELNIINGFTLNTKIHILQSLIQKMQGWFREEKEKRKMTALNEASTQICTPDSQIEWFKAKKFFKKY